MSKISDKELARVLVDKYGLDRAAAERFVEQMFEVVNDSLKSDRIAKVKGLGTFKMTSVASRKSVDVNTGEPIVIEGRDKINFTAENSMRDQVNRPFAQFETVVVNDGVDFDEIDRQFAEDIVEDDDLDDGEERCEQAEETVVVMHASAGDDEKEPSEKIVKPNVEPAEDTTGEKVNDFSIKENAEPVAADIGEREPEKAESPAVGEVKVEPIAFEATSTNSVDDEPATAETSDTEPAETSSGAPVETPATGPIDAEPVLTVSADQLAVLDGQPDVAAEESDGAEALSGAITNIEAEKASEATNGESKSPNVEKEVPNEEAEVIAAATARRHRKQFETEDTEFTLIKNHNNELIKQLGRQHRYMRVVVVVGLLLLAVCIAGIVYMMTQLERRDHRIQHLEAEATASRQPDSVEEKTNKEAMAKAVAAAKDDSMKAAAELAAIEKAEKESRKEAEEKAAKEQEAIKAQERVEARRLAEEEARATAAQKTQTQKPSQANAVSAKQREYEKDARIRTGAYNIVGVDRTVTVKPGQTLFSISKLYLGPGMECYVEAVNGWRKEFKAGEKINIPKLQHKKKR